MFWRPSNVIHARLYVILGLVGTVYTTNEPPKEDNDTDESGSTDQLVEETIERKFANLNELLDQIFYTTREELIFEHRKDQINKPLPDVDDLSLYINNRTLVPSNPNVKRLSYFVNNPNFFGHSLPEHNRTRFVNICTILWKYPQFVALLQELSKECDFHPLLTQILKLYEENGNFQHFNRRYIDSLALLSAVVCKKPDSTKSTKVKEIVEELKEDIIEEEEPVHAETFLPDELRAEGSEVEINESEEDKAEDPEESLTQHEIAALKEESTLETEEVTMTNPGEELTETQESEGLTNIEAESDADEELVEAQKTPEGEDWIEDENTPETQESEGLTNIEAESDADEEDEGSQTNDESRADGEEK